MLHVDFQNSYLTFLQYQTNINDRKVKSKVHLGFFTVRFEVARLLFELGSFGLVPVVRVGLEVPQRRWLLLGIDR